MIKWIPTAERMPTDEEHAAGLVALWVYPGETRDYDRYDMETTSWKPSVWGRSLKMPDYWAALSSFDLPAIR